MTLHEIITSIIHGKKVFWKSSLYKVVGHGCDPLDYYIVCQRNNNTIGLTWCDGVTLNGREKEFYCE